MDISVGAKIIFFAYKQIPLLEKIYLKIKPQELNGLWCSCWKYDPDKESHQVGTMVVKQFNKNVLIDIYSAGNSWNIRGTFKDNIFLGRYNHTFLVDYIALFVSSCPPRRIVEG